jgi:caa(3)-type oxidase subunit IV
MENNQSHSDLKRDLTIYGAIIVLTALIVTISHLNLGVVGIFLIVPIACAEASVLAYFFMHLSENKKAVHLLLLLTIVVFLSLLFWPAWDIVYSPRTHSEYNTN